MTSGTKAILIGATLWSVLFIGAWFVSRANAARDVEHPRLWATSEATGQTYDVFELRAGDRFAGFDIERARVRFADCDLPPAPEGERPIDCLDTSGNRWTLTR
jgi:hypothetical protein